MERQLEEYLVTTFQENAGILSLYPAAFARALVGFNPGFARQVASFVLQLTK
jgi:hypothetical protein